jgi:AdoMet-dependent heme synthase
MRPTHHPNLIRQPVYDLNQRPFMVIWETTQACDLACKHCRAESQKDHHPQALTFEEGKDLVEQILEFGKPSPLFILTGGDPFKLDDIFDLTTYAANHGLAVALSPSGTPLLNWENLSKLKACGCKAISLSLDGSNAQIHDSFRGVEGSFKWTTDGWQAARELGIKIQINTTVTRYNLFDLPNTFALVQDIGAMTWSVFFLVPTGRALLADEISPEDYEAVMNFLYDASKYIGIKTTEGHHFKRVVLQRAFLESIQAPYRKYMTLNGTYDQLLQGLVQVTNNRPLRPPSDRIKRTPMHINAGDGFVFISLLGEVFPSGYLPVSAGNVRQTSLKEIYQSNPMFISLRNKKNLKGRCGACEFNSVCGGSRSRAYAMTGDLLSEEPYCLYEPGSFPFSHQIPELSLR